MKTVKTKKELIEAIKNGEKEVYVDSKKLFLACRMAEKYGGSPSDLTDKSPNELAVEMGVVSEPVIIVLIVAAMILAISIIAVSAKYEVVIVTEVDPKRGRLTGKVILRKKLR